ncbi:hypothetical protein KPL78_07320 [Roseomonas sp. HJA6]|uniref:Restriction endonuclease n=1 Tax=Roseomonas alba TaxID=2846776 RepID=A0ABS7A5Q4_9PROT|nr:hypothetical protein [Neoroseomonas alba]MBW6397647.1 hypothetical protein [Neoroseomonas alba]
MPGTHAGSRRHILDWVEGRGGDFVASANALIAPTGAVLAAERAWMPTGHAHAAEARLGRPCEPLLTAAFSQRLREWWLAVPKPTANDPNWDLAAVATFPGGVRGLLLVEAKAHLGELAGEMIGKRWNATSNRENHDRIGAAIAEARQALGGEAAGIGISRDRCYQFSNRVAFAWRLASWGVPVVLVYLGFTGDRDVAGPGQMIRDDAHWGALMLEHTRNLMPAAAWETPLPTTGATFWMLMRSLPAPSGAPTVLTVPGHSAVPGAR